MGYTMEMSMNLLKTPHFLEIENDIIHYAKEFRCENIYRFSEMDGTLKIPRYHFVLVAEFSAKEINYFLEFIKYIKKQKSISIECVYSDKLVVNLIYASSFYLKNITRLATVHYKEQQRKQSYSEEELTIFYTIVE